MPIILNSTKVEFAMTNRDDHPNSIHNQSDEHQKIAYYKRIAAESGIRRLRETEVLSQLIVQHRQVVEALKKTRNELEQRTSALSMANASLKREIRERIRMTGELVESEKKYRAMFEDAPDAISVTQDGRIVDVNPAWLKLHGYESKEEVAGTDIIDAIHPADRHILLKRRQAWPDIAQGGYPIRDIRKDGVIADVEIYARRICINGRDAIISTLHDLTERNKSESEKRKLEERLRQSEKMKAVGALAGGVAHDLNNVLGGLISYPDLLLLDLPDESSLKGPLTTIKRSGQKAAAIVQDLLTLARRGVSVTKTVDLNQIIREYLASPEFDRLIRHHDGIFLLRNLDADLSNIMGSSVHLSKTLMNLISNAAEAIPGGGTVTITTRNHMVDEKSESDVSLHRGEYVLLEIADTGVGIAKSDLKRIFEPFYTKKVMGRSGTGLGMTVVWGTVKDHHGHIEVKSVVGKGTRFSLFFPATERRLRKKDDDKTLELPMGRGEIILVIDDVFEQREMACGILDRLGYKVVAVSSGDEAVAYANCHGVNLLLLDMVMDPDMDGDDTYHETYQRILQIHPGQKAVIVSGYSKFEYINKTRGLGPCGFLKKPYTLESMAKTVRCVLDEPLSSKMFLHNRPINFL